MILFSWGYLSIIPFLVNLLRISYLVLLVKVRIRQFFIGDSLGLERSLVMRRTIVVVLPVPGAARPTTNLGIFADLRYISKIVSCPLSATY
jgi:hypothetical protein